MKHLFVKAPAKVNLYLDIKSKRSDGYHDIETVFEKITLFDEITLKKSKAGIKIASSDKNLPLGEGNICHKAARIIMDYAGIDEGIVIDIKKNIPIAAGLGGGSSNAACVLTAVKKLFDLDVGDDNVLKFACELGADVPFFLSDTNYAKAEGRGDIISPLSGPNMCNLIIYPGFGLSTKEAYENTTLSLTRRGGDIKMLLLGLSQGDVRLIGKTLFNAFEEMTFPKYPELALIKQELKDHNCAGALMSGSGSCIFGLFEDKKAAEKARDYFQGRGHKAYTADTFSN